MMYTAEQIKPKRYPDEKPSHDRVLAYPDLHGEWLDYYYEDRQHFYPWDTRPIQWFINIPGAPPELKPIAYPKNKPEQEGMYWVHLVPKDKWIISQCILPSPWDRDNVDHFIPYRLDKENEMDVKVFMDWDNKTGEVNITKPVTLEKGDFMAVVRRYLFEFGYQIIERLDCARVPDKENEMKDDKSAYDLEWESRELLRIMEALNDTVEWIARNACKSFLNKIGYDVARKEPEIKACPNPECESEVYISNKSGAARIICNLCGYQSSVAYSESEAIRLHNMIADKSRRNGEE